MPLPGSTAASWRATASSLEFSGTPASAFETGQFAFRVLPPPLKPAASSRARANDESAIFVIPIARLGT